MSASAIPSSQTEHKPGSWCASCYGRGWNYAGIVRYDAGGRPYSNGTIEKAECRWCGGTGRRP